MLFTMLGLVVFSPVSSILSMSFLHLPLALPELFFLPFCFLLRRKFCSVKIKVRVISNAAFLFTVLLLCAIFSATFSLFAILSNARAWIYLLLFFCLFRYDNDITLEDFKYLAVGSLIGWTGACLFNINNFILVGDYHINVTYGLMLSLPLFYSIVIYKKEKSLLTLGLILTMIIIIFCGTRRVILIATISIFTSILIIGIIKKKSILLYTLITCFAIILINTAMPVIENVVQEISPHLHFRLFTRTKTLINEGVEASQDDVRFSILSSTYEEMEKSCLPNGFISMQTDSDKSIGHYNDYPLTMLMWIFSWPIAFLILLYIMKITAKNIKAALKTGELPPFISSICLLTMLLLLFLDGSFITYAYATPITGALLGLSIKTANNVNYKKCYDYKTKP